MSCIPLDLFNLTTIKHVQVGYEQRKRINLTETESVCLDAVFSTGETQPSCDQTDAVIPVSDGQPALDHDLLPTQDFRRWYTHVDEG